MDFSRFTHLTFDCYGTLIDWETGILRALRPVLAGRLRPVPSDDEVLGLYAALEAAIEAGPYRSYREVLEQVVRGFGERLSFVASAAEAAALPESLGDWLPFPDTVDSLQRLARVFKLAIISNVDDDLIAATLARLGVPFADVITAQQARSYKPSPGNFQLAMRRLAVPAAQILHVAQSLYHDVAPARKLGLATVWVNRRKGRSTPGATPPATAVPDLEVPDLKTLADLAVR
jgi:2-haloacid dehalogenase